MDNQIFNTPFSNVLTTLKAVSDQPFLSFRISKGLEYNNITFFNTIQATVQKAVVHVDEAFLTHLIYNINGIVDFVNAQKEVKHSYKDYTKLEVSISDMIFIHKMGISNVEVSVSFLGSKQNIKKIDDRSLQRILRLTGKLASIDRAPVHLPSFSLSTHFSPAPDFGKIMQDFYVSSLIKHAFIFLGAKLNPVSWFAGERVMKRVRDPKTISKENRMNAFSGISAEGQKLLHTIDKGDFQDEFYVFHYPYLSDTKATNFLLISDQHFILLEGNFEKVRVAWKVKLSKITHIRLAEKHSVLQQKGIWLMTDDDAKYIPSFSKEDDIKQTEDFFVYYSLIDIFHRETNTKRMTKK